MVADDSNKLPAVKDHSMAPVAPLRA
jgi:hypothetical protein